MDSVGTLDKRGWLNQDQDLTQNVDILSSFVQIRIGIFNIYSDYSTNHHESFVKYVWMSDVGCLKYISLNIRV